MARDLPDERFEPVRVDSRVLHGYISVNELRYNQYISERFMNEDTRRLWQTALLLEYFTVAYNIGEAAASILFGTLAGSIALVGFGLDSIVESLSGCILIWRLRRHDTCSREEEERIERAAQRLVAVTFFILGLYILYESAGKLLVAPKVAVPGAETRLQA